jgi:hypothetical protein
MQRIIKNTLAGNLIIDGVLNSAWNTVENRYEGNLYYGIIDKNSRTKLVTLFLAEQNCMCCYCMKEIIANDVTIEHIIPQNASIAEFNTYLSVTELSSTLIHQSIFDRNNLIIPPLRYPHDLGYNNLIASCDSTTHCNNKRGKAFITPFMYDEEIVNDISYEPFGSVYSTTAEIEELKLNSDFLKMVRKLWFLISKKIKTLNGINNVTD